MIIPIREPFGSTGRYYAGRSADARSATRQKEIIDQLIDTGTHDQVSQVCKEWNNAIREQLRNATGLKLTVAGHRASVPVRVIGGLPLPLAEIVEENSAELLWWITLNRSALIKTSAGLDLLQPRMEEITRALKWPSDKASNDDAVSKTKYLIHEAIAWQEASKITEKIRELETDTLGAYFFRIPIIHIYWQAIGMFAAILQVSVEHLTMAVLAHELAHAYTHIGRDIDNTNWETQAFAEADLHIVEGLAQFYTAMVCDALDRRRVGLKAAFEKLLANQSSPYTCFTSWVDDHDRAGEVVRHTAVHCRAHGIRKYEDFLDEIESTKKNLPSIKRTARRPFQ